MRGCLLCQASASALSSVAVGRNAAGIAELRHDAERALGREPGETHEPFDAFAPVASAQVAARSACFCRWKTLKDALFRVARRYRARTLVAPLPRLCHSRCARCAGNVQGETMRLLMNVVALLGLIAFPTFAFAQDLTLKRVMLSSGGLGYFEYEASVDGDATLEAHRIARPGRRRAEEPRRL